MTSCALCCRSTVLPTMNGIYGTDASDVTPLQGSSFPHLSPQGVALGWYVTPFQGWAPKSGAGEVAKTMHTNR